MAIEFGMPVVAKNDKAIGNIGKVIMDTWTGKPRKYMVRQEAPGPDTIIIFSPEQISEVNTGKVKLNVAIEEPGKT